MKNRILKWFPDPVRSFIPLLALTGGLTAGAAALPSDWQNEQSFSVTTPGLIKLSLPAATLDAAQPALADLRLYDDAGAEVPWLVERPLPGTAAMLPARAFQATLNADATVLLVETGTTQAIDGILLETPAQNFIKPVRVEGSPDGHRWQLLATGRPLFRQPGGVTQLQLPLLLNVWHSLRLTVDDRRAAPLPFTGARLHVPAATGAPAETLPVTIAERHENPGETRLTLNLGAANLDLAGLDFETTAPLFTRNVTLAVPQVSETAIHEAPVGQGVIYRLAIDGQTNLENLTVSLERQIHSRELVVLIHNQDSPPLALTAVRAERRPVYLVFLASHAGTYHLLTGNPQALAPHYDLAAFAPHLKTIGVSPVQMSALTANPDYHPPETLPDIATTGPELDTKDWKYRKPVQISQPGVQELELDLDVLAHAQSDLGDLRLMTTTRQVPYILEHTSIHQTLTPAVTVIPDAKSPKISRWRLSLPQARLPLSRLSCTTASALFQRQIWVYEELPDERGSTYRQSLGSASWNQTPDARRTEFTLVLDRPPQSNTLFLETDNGDNPPLELDHFQVFYPVTRVWFKIGSAMPVSLYYGNPGVGAPHYDLTLVANQLLAAPKTPATGGPEELLRKSSWTETRIPGRGGVLFWGILAVVVAGLLFIIARLLPKNAPPPDQP
ncbi:MAG TPA: DUF3999 family protein [Dongiaceae bacterium]|nr:DUF3999 family protein [Dongiaceae bacterium]